MDVVYYVAVSLDGYIATQDGGVEWLAPFEANAEDYGYTDFFASVDVMVMGSRTYEQTLTFGDWPYDGKSCWVFSQRLLKANRTGIVVTSSQPEEVLLELENQGFQRAWLVGGGGTCRFFSRYEAYN